MDSLFMTSEYALPHVLSPSFSAWLAYNNHHMSFGNHRTTPVISVTSVQYSTPVDLNEALDLLSQIESSFR